MRAWLSGIDGSGSRAVWILFEGGLGGGLSLCSLILNDESGILEVAGGPITRKRLERELESLREHQKLPWVDSDPARAGRLVAEALDLHARLGTEPPPEFSRWRRVFSATAASTLADPPSPAPAEIDGALLDRSAELADLPELGGWFVEPALVQEDALALLQARESRLIVSDQIKAEREAAIIEGVIERLFTADARRRWAHRLGEMALIFEATGRDEPAAMARGRRGGARRRGSAGARDPARARPRAPRPRDGRRGRPGPREALRRDPRGGAARALVIPGLRVGHVTDPVGLTGVTVLLPDRPAVGGVDIRGWAVGIHGLEFLDPRHLVPTLDGVVLAGGSAFGLEAIWGVMQWLEERGVGFATSQTVVPHVAGAILYDLGVGDHRARPDRAMGYAAAAAARPGPVAEGNVGAGTGATVGKLRGAACAMKGGLGCATGALGDVAVGALVAVNAVGDVRDPETGRLIAGTRNAADGRLLIDTAAALAAGAPAAALPARQHDDRRGRHDGGARQGGSHPSRPARHGRIRPRAVPASSPVGRRRAVRALDRRRPRRPPRSRRRRGPRRLSRHRPGGHDGHVAPGPPLRPRPAER